MNPTVTGPLSGLSVLIVEDESLIAFEAERIVNEAGAREVAIARSVASAREHFDAKPDLAILDMGLADGNGRALLSELSSRDIPFVITSGMAFDPPHGMEGAIVLGKPYRASELIDALLTALAGSA